jgi:hypothetical protein
MPAFNLPEHSTQTDLLFPGLEPVYEPTTWISFLDYGSMAEDRSAWSDPTRDEYDSEEFQPPEWSVLYKEEIRICLDLLAPQQVQILLLFQEGMSQEDIAKKYQCSQPSICFLLKQISKWLKIVVPIRVSCLASRDQLWRPPLPRNSSRLTYEVLDRLFEGYFWAHRSQSEIGRELGVTQGFIRHWLRSAAADPMAPSIVPLAWEVGAMAWATPGRRGLAFDATTGTWKPRPTTPGAKRQTRRWI